MDADRKSTVSSFYGARKTSVDALNTELSPTTPQFPRDQRRDSAASSFYNPDTSRRSVDPLSGARPPGAGYNQSSWQGREEPIKGGRDEEQGGQDQGWDVFADFNNAGPKYSTAFGAQGGDGYQKLDPTKGDDAVSSAGTTEMVTVPALGPEWRADEMRDMTKAGKREKAADSRRQRIRAWTRSDDTRWLTKRFMVFVVFGTCIVVGLIVYFTLPRVPAFGFNNDAPFQKSEDFAFSRAPANFSFTTFADIEANTVSSYLPVHLTNLHAEVFDIDTGRQVAYGNLNDTTLPAKEFPKLQMPLTFSYFAANDSDTTWRTMYAACRNKGSVPGGGGRPGLKLKMTLNIHIRGLISKSEASTDIQGAACPFELPIDSV